MKKIFLIAAGFFFAISSNAQTVNATVYGNFNATGNAIKADDLESNLENNKYEGLVSGKVVEVCLEKGCWLRLEKADGTTLMVKAVDHGFAVPKDLVGKTVLAEGKAFVKEISEKQRKHFEKDAGKSKREIAKIKGSSKEIMFMANGVKVVE